MGWFQRSSMDEWFYQFVHYRPIVLVTWWHQLHSYIQNWSSYKFKSILWFCIWIICSNWSRFCHICSSYRRFCFIYVFRIYWKVDHWRLGYVGIMDWNCRFGKRRSWNKYPILSKYARFHKKPINWNWMKRNKTMKII